MNRVKDFLNMILKNIIFVLAAVVAGTVIMIAVQCLPAGTIKSMSASQQMYSEARAVIRRCLKDIRGLLYLIIIRMQRCLRSVWQRMRTEAWHIMR